MRHFFGTLTVLFGVLLFGFTGHLYAQNSEQAVSDSTKVDSVKIDLKLPKITSFSFQGKKPSPLLNIPSTNVKTVVTRDSNGYYRISNQIYGIEYSVMNKGLREYSKFKLEQQKADTWKKLADEAHLKRDSQKGLLDFKLSIPGGSNSAFTTIFGKPEVNLSVTGRANMNIGATISNNKNPSIPQPQQKRVDPAFNQNLQLNIQGSIGDKLTIRTDWDTERPFDYQNRLSIVYEGYEDEIIKRIELGNVSMETGNSLIRGGGALFGMKSIAQFGPVTVTSVLSQQEGKSQTEKISSGTKETQISIRPNNYQNDQHFFLDFFLRQEYETAMADPNVIQLPLNNMANLKVYRRIITTNQNNDGIKAVALADLGVVSDGQGGYLPPDMRQDNLDDNLLDELRTRENLTAEDVGVSQEDFIIDSFEELRLGEDYTWDQTLGTISFRQRLNNSQVIAISFQYQRGNETVQVGELLPLGTSDLIFLKMIRPSIPSSSNSLWDLTMRNIYYIGTNGLTSGDLDLRIWYTGQNPEIEVLPGVGGQNLLQELGLDRVGPNNVTTPDNVIDFGGTFNGNEGLIIFPYLEPFGSRIEQIIDRNSPPEADLLANNLAFNELYDQLPTIQNNKNQAYEIKGTAKGGIESFYSLGFALVEGSVKVNANGETLLEGVDYVVDYAIGSIQILSKTYLTSGYEITIEYENNQLIQIQQTSFAGVRAAYEVNENISFGSTVFRLKERPLTDKIRVGDEPINNSVIGFDANAKFDAPWLTRFIDKIPLLQTKEPSSVTFSGEFAQLRPSVARTNTVERQAQAGDFFPDENSGISFIDDFEGVKNNITFLNPGRWNLASAPAGIPGYDNSFNNPATYSNSSSDKIERNNHRAEFTWYSIPLVSSAGFEPNAESEQVKASAIFDRNFANRQEDILRTMDLYYNPTNRGPYNYNLNMRNLLEREPENTWGGMTATLPNNLENLDQNNVEFIEFWVSFVLPYGREPDMQDIMDYNGKMFIDIGQISEDVIPNSQFNSEDGLSENNSKVIDAVNLSWVQPSNNVNRDGAFSLENIEEEDVGLDGVINTSNDGADSEEILFQNFVQTMEVQYSDKPDVVERIRQDPSNDDFLFSNINEPSDTTLSRFLNERYWRTFGYHEGNSTVAGRQAYPRPDTEGLVTPGNVNSVNQYFQYELDINPADTSSLQIGRNFIVDRTIYGRRRTYERFYQIRVPVKEFTRKIGEITDFSQISHFRIWFSGYKKPFTLRFATLEFVGSQWRKSTQLYGEDPTTVHELATINREENLNRRPIPYITPPGAITSITRGQQNVVANEQALLMTIENLRRGNYRMASKVYNGGLNLLNYSNMRMDVHGEGYDRREEVQIIIRLGNDLENNYYEYRQFVTPSDPNYPYAFPDELGEKGRTNEQQDNDAYEIWKPDENSVNIILSVFNILKQNRNGIGFDQNAVFLQEMSALLPNQAEKFAPGAVVAVKGNPSLRKINEIGLGIMNPLELGADGAMVTTVGSNSLNAEIWFNELRVSGFEDAKGWRANARSSVKLADFATVSANYNQSNDGFGAINSSLGDRQRFNDRNVDLSTTVNLHKFIPDRFGWTFPVNVSYRNNFREETFLTQEADVRFDDFTDAVESRQDLDEEQKQEIIADKREEIETVKEDFTFAMSNIRKQYSKWKILQYTLDNLTGNFNYSTSDSRSPQNARQYNWNYTAGLNYNLSFKNVKMLQPFAWASEVPFFKILSEFRLGYKPTSITASSSLNRTYSETERRVFAGQSIVPLQQTHDMNSNSTFSLAYNLTPNIAFNYGNSTRFNMAQAGIDSTQNFITGDSTRIYLRPTFETLDNLLDGKGDPAVRSQYSENYSLSWRPKINNIKALDWLTYNASYQANFGWLNNNVGRNSEVQLGASLSNSGTLNHTLKLATGKLFEKMEFYKKAKETDKTETRKRAADKKKKAEERQKRKEEAKKEREAAEKAKASGETVPETPEEKSKPKKSQIGVPKQATGQEPQSVKPEDSKTKAVDPNKSNDIGFFARKIFLGLTSFQSFDISYADKSSASQGAYAGQAPIYYAFNTTGNYSPNLAYRFGLDQFVDDQSIIINPNQQIRTQWKFDDNFTVRTSFQPVENLKIDLNWNTGWAEDNSITRTSQDENDLTILNGQAGSFGTTTWAFGDGYRALLETQIGVAFADIVDGSSLISDETGNQDGQTVLGPEGLLRDFRAAYMGSLGQRDLGKHGFGAVPLPNWTITYQGLETKFPALKNIFNRVSINHAYVGRYQSGFSFTNGFETQVLNANLGGFSTSQGAPEFAPSQTTLESSFRPMIGMSLTWKNNMRTNIDYESARRVSFSYNSSRVDENTSQGIKFNLNFEKRGFKLPFFKKLNNTVTISTTFNYSEEITKRYNLSADLNNALDLTSEAYLLRDPKLAEITEPEPLGTGRIQGALVVGYQFSSMIQANFEYTYTHILPRSTNTFERIDQDIRFNIVVSIRSR